jgi:hypothetical protein
MKGGGQRRARGQAVIDVTIYFIFFCRGFGRSRGSEICGTSKACVGCACARNWTGPGRTRAAVPERERDRERSRRKTRRVQQRRRRGLINGGGARWAVTDEGRGTTKTIGHSVRLMDCVCVCVCVCGRASVLARAGLRMSAQRSGSSSSGDNTVVVMDEEEDDGDDVMGWGGGGGAPNGK